MNMKEMKRLFLCATKILYNRPVPFFRPSVLIFSRSFLQTPSKVADFLTKFMLLLDIYQLPGDAAPRGGRRQDKHRPRRPHQHYNLPLPCPGKKEMEGSRVVCVLDLLACG